MLAMQSIESLPAMGMEHNREGRPLKPKTLPCKYCSKRFRRVEHVQRHERTHTKEKPFACNWARCGKTFGRRDLLVRHEKLVHLNENSRDGARVRKNSSISGPSGSSDSSNTEPRSGLQHPQLPQLSQLPQLPQLPHQQAFAAPPPPPPVPQQQPQPQQQPPLMSPAHRTAPSLPQQPPSAADPRLSSNLDLLSDAATHLASANEITAAMPPLLPVIAQPAAGSMAGVKAYTDATSPPYADRRRVVAAAAAAASDVLPPAYPGQPPTASFDDYHLFLDDFSSSSHFLPPTFESDPQFNLWSRPDLLGRGGPAAHLTSKMAPSFPSTRFPSVQPDLRDLAGDATTSRPQDDLNMMRAPAWRIAAADHTVIKNRLEEFTSVLPPDFVFPSRHTLTRFLEGYAGGFHEHIPILHLPTLSPAELSPELILAILAVGAQYRFESHRANALWYAAKSVAFEQIRRRHSHEVHSLLPTASAYSPHSTRPSPSSSYRHSFNSMQQDRPMTQETHREPFSPNTPQSRLETIQALLLLFAVGIWGPKAILHEALSLQSTLALLMRDEGLVSETSAHATDWETWIRVEGSTRTKLMAFCYFNLCSIVYNTTPMLLTSEVDLFLPQPSRLWRMETAWQWQEARQNCPLMEMSLQDAFSRILDRDARPLTHVSSLGNYVLIHAFIQHIFLLKQTSFAISSSFGVHRGLKSEDIEEVSQGLRLWQVGFEQHQQMREAEVLQHPHPHSHQHQMSTGSGSGLGLGLDNPMGGSVGFNATALLRLAYIRLYTDLNPSQRLETRDPLLIASAFHDVPLLARSQRTIWAVIQAVHALAMLVKAGVNYVARTKSLEWSMQHSLCNMECAILLSKWLVTLASIGPADAPITAEEKALLDNVRRLLDETEFAVPIDPSLAGMSMMGSASSASSSGRTSSAPGIVLNDGAKMRQLAVAVIRLWAETFKGAHIFEAVSMMGLGLENYADILEKTREQTPLNRIPTTVGLA